MPAEAGRWPRVRVRTVTRGRARRRAPEESFRPPSDISMATEALPDGTAYIFRHWGMGVLGRIRIHERPIDGSNLTCETAGDPADPMTAQRAAIFEPLGRAPADPGSWAARGLCATSVPGARELEPAGVDRMPGPQAAIERSRYRRCSTGMAGARTGRGHGGRRVRCDTGPPGRGALQERLNR
jgi:hypothetical protein